MTIYSLSNNFILSQLRKSFAATGVSEELIQYIYYFFLFFLFIIPILILVHFTVNYFLKKRENDYGSVFDKDILKDVFNMALLQRSRFDVRVGKTKSTFYCALIDFDNDYLYLELPSYLKISNIWFKRKIKCFFKIGKDKLSSIYYNFSTQVEDFYLDRGVYILKVKFPLKLDLGQKRKFLRISLPSKYIKEIKIWTAKLDRYSGFSKDPLTWSKPIGIYNEKEKGLLLKDISSGGVKLGIRKDLIHNTVDFKRENEYLFFYLKINYPKELKKDFFYFICRLKNYYPEGKEEYYYWGLQFVAVGNLIWDKEQQKNILNWKDLDINRGSEDLGNWLFKTYLEIYREKGLI
jgi:hypothetical protein